MFRIVITATFRKSFVRFLIRFQGISVITDAGDGQPDLIRVRLLGVVNDTHPLRVKVHGYFSNSGFEAQVVFYSILAR